MKRRQILRKSIRVSQETSSNRTKPVEPDRDGTAGVFVATSFVYNTKGRVSGKKGCPKYLVRKTKDRVRWTLVQLPADFLRKFESEKLNILFEVNNSPGALASAELDLSGKEKSYKISLSKTLVLYKDQDVFDETIIHEMCHVELGHCDSLLPFDADKAKEHLEKYEAEAARQVCELGFAGKLLASIEYFAFKENDPIKIYTGNNRSSVEAMYERMGHYVGRTNSYLDIVREYIDVPFKLELEEKHRTVVLHLKKVATE